MTTDDDSKQITRRDVMRASVAAGTLALGLGAEKAAAAAPRAKRYAIVGVGSRSGMFQDAIQTTHAQHSELVACVDVNHGRLKLAQARAREHGRPEPRSYAGGEFDRMLAETRPDTVIVTTVDGFHDEYIVRALALGADVITEKPMTTDAAKCQRIIDARRASKRRITVAFNYRYTPVRSQIKEILMSGLIGDVLSVDFQWLLDTKHGADYFRRWHSQKRLSGGLMVHKATHHFDLVNWWLSAIPISVRGFGKRAFYTPQMARRLGLSGPHERCHTCPEKAKCSFELSLAKNPRFKALYLDNEKYDRYFRDQCVFRPEIDIEDTMNVVVNYDTGATLSYSVNAFNAWEGCIIAFNGTKGRLEHRAEEKITLFGDGSVHGALKSEGTTLRLYPLRKGAYQIPVRTGSGGHGGGDPLMMADLFAPGRVDPLLRAADERAGAYSILVGVAANRCFETGQTVNIADLVKHLARPDYPRMPALRAAVPMPPKV
jgi:predicted dehydrogenase